MSQISTATKVNRGYVAELILGAAITAHYLRRPYKEINQYDIDKVVARYLMSATSSKSTILEYDGQHAANVVSLRVGIPQSTFDYIRTINVSETYSDLYQSAMSYVNDSEAFASIASEQRFEEISIVADGMTAGKDSKADVHIRLNGLKADIQVSLKIESGNQFAQFCGVSFDTMRDMFGSLGVTFKPEAEAEWNEKIKDYDPKAKFAARGVETDAMLAHLRPAVNSVYMNAFFELCAIHRTPEFKRNLAAFIRKGATNNEPGVELVKFADGSYKVQKFGPAFEDAIMSMRLETTFSMETTILTIWAVDENDVRSPLITIRAKYESPSTKIKGQKVYKTYLRHYIEAPMDSALYKIKT